MCRPHHCSLKKTGAFHIRKALQYRQAYSMHAFPHWGYHGAARAGEAGRLQNCAACRSLNQPRGSRLEGGHLHILIGVPDLGLQDERAVAVVVLFRPHHEVQLVARVQPVQEEVQALPRRRLQSMVRLLTFILPPGLLEMRLMHHQEHQTGHPAHQHTIRGVVGHSHNITGILGFWQRGLGFG